MIAIASGTNRERAALAALCAQRGWSTTECASVLSVRNSFRRYAPRVVIARHQLPDGYSDDVISLIASMHDTTRTKTIVLLNAGAASSMEARQLSLGADCVQRDPVRIDVLLAYIDKFLSTTFAQRPSRARTKVAFIDAVLTPLDRTLHRHRRTVSLTPREAMLVELLAAYEGAVVPYEMLYQEILGRKFNGDTSNMRVLLAKLSTSTAKIGLRLRQFVNVVPKSGYRCVARRSPAAFP